MDPAIDEIRSGKGHARQEGPSQRIRAETSTEFKNEGTQAVNKSNTEAGASQALGAEDRGAFEMVIPTLPGRTISYDRQELGGFIRILLRVGLPMLRATNWC